MEALWRPLKRARASISGPVSTNSSEEGKENKSDLKPSASHGDRRKQRAQSLGGPLHAQLNKHEEALSPRKKARRSLVPGRSILKASAGPVNAFSPFFPPPPPQQSSSQPQQDENSTATLQHSATATMTGPAEPSTSQESMATASSQQSEDRRKSLARRVSFCDRVTMREFERDNQQAADDSTNHSSSSSSPEQQQGQQQQQQLSNSVIVHADQPANASPLQSGRYSDLFEQSMDMANDDVTGAFGAALNNQSNLVDEAPMTFVNDSSEPEDDDDQDQDHGDETAAMDMVDDPHATTAAFAHNTVILSQSQRARQSLSENDAAAAGMTQQEAEEAEASLLALGSGDEFEVPLRPQGVSFSDEAQARSVNSESRGDDQDSDADASAMDMDVSGDTSAGGGGTGMYVSDGVTSRRVSVGGTLRRGSLAPGHAALAMLDAYDEEEDEGTEEMDESNQTVQFAEPSSHQQQPFHPDQENSRTVTSKPRASLSSQKPRSSLQPKPHPAFAPPHQSPVKSTSSSQSPRRASVIPKPQEQQASPFKPAKKRPSHATEAQSSHLPRPSTSQQQQQPAPTRKSVGFARPSLVPEPPLPSDNSQQPPPAQPEREASTSTVEDEPANDVQDDGQSQMMAMSTEDEADDEDMQQDEDQGTHNAMSLEDFFQTCQIRFMDDVFSSKRKSSSSRKSLLPEEQSAAVKSKATLADQLFAMGCLVHDLDMYSLMSKELRKSMEENGDWLDDIDSVVQDAVPDVFRRYMEGSEDERSAMEKAFKTAKSFFRSEVRSEWYVYRQSALQSACAVFDGHHEGLNKDLQFVAQMRKELAVVFPELQTRQTELQKELEKERARETELAQCDQEELAGLREAIAEQEEQVNSFAREQADVDAQLERVKSKMSELAAQKEEHQRSIAEAQAFREAAGFTSTEQVAILQDRLRTVETLHSWQLLEYNNSELKLLYMNDICVVLRLVKTGVDRIQLSLYRELDQHTDQQTAVKAFLFDRVKQEIESQESYGSAPMLLHRVSAVWNAAQRLMFEIKQLRRRFPLSISLVMKKSRPAPFLRIAARIHWHDARAAANVLFELTGEEICLVEEQQVVAEIGCSVEQRFGDIDCSELSYIIRDCVSNGEPGAFLRACEELEAKLT